MNGVDCHGLHASVMPELHGIHLLVNLGVHECYVQGRGATTYKNIVRKNPKLAALLKRSFVEILDGSEVLESPLLLVNRWHSNYYHFLLETLPALLDFVSGSNGFRRGQVLVVDRLNFGMESVLSRLNFAGEIRQNVGTSLLMNNPCCIRPLDLGCLEDDGLKNHLSSVALLLQSFFDVDARRTVVNELPRRFFIERRSLHQGSQRVFWPQQAFHRTLLAKGYSILYLEDFTLEGQIQLFAQAEKVIAMHGAALANVLFCSQQCEVVEFIHERLPRPTHFQKIANAVGLNRFNVVPLKGALESSDEEQEFFRLHQVAPNDLRLPLRFSEEVLDYL